MDTQPRHQDQVSPAEWAMRVDVAACYRLVEMFGWSDLLGTHISAQVPGEENAFLINPYGLLFDEITASSLVKVDEEGDILSQTEYGINPAGFVIHGAVHIARPEVACALHTHTPAGTGVAIQTGGILPLSQQALQVIGHTGYHDYEGPPTDPGTVEDDRARLVRDLGHNNILVLRNHGLLTVGRSVAEAFVWMYRAERACRIQLAFQSSGAEPVTLSEAVQQTTIARNRLANSPQGHRPIGKLEWPALLRRLDRVDPSYKQ